MAGGEAKTFIISPAYGDAEMVVVRQLFRDYERAIETDLCFQGFAAELAGLPGKYVPPSGALFLALDAKNNAIGCVALRPTESPLVAEMKRLFVTPAGRGMGLGRALVETAISQARNAGYLHLRLDTLPTMAKAVALYESMGFQPIAPYYETPVANTRFLALDLTNLP